MPTLYRVENRETDQGLWYNKWGHHNGFIRQFGDALCHDLPMPFDPEMKLGGNWLSACDNLGDMSNWFSLNDLKRLHAIGYKLYRLQVPRYKRANGHAVFLRSDVVNAEEAPIQLICKEWSDDH